MLLRPWWAAVRGAGSRAAASQSPGSNHLKETDRNGVAVKTSFEINVKGPPPGAVAGASYPDGANTLFNVGEGVLVVDANLHTSVDLTFKFVRRDNGSPVIIPWMQFTLFDFDQNNDGNTGNGVEARGPPPCEPRPPDPLTPGPSPVCAVHESQWVRRLRALQRAGRGGR